MIKRLLKISIYIQPVIAGIIYICTWNIFYSIIYLTGGILSVSGFVLLIKMIDRILQIDKKRGQGMYFAASALKFIVIAAVFYPVSRVSEAAVLFYIFGLSVIPLSIFVEGGYQLYRSFSNAGT